MFRYAARNAMLPSFTGFAMALGGVVGGALLTEIVFSYPGIGYLLYEALQKRDYPMMQGVFLLITLDGPAREPGRRLWRTSCSIRAFGHEG